MKRSYVGAFRAMTAAFLAAEAEILGSHRTWHAINPQQERLLSEIFSFTRGEDSLIPEIDKKVAWDANTINQFLKEHGMNIELQPFGSDTFGFAAVMKIMVQWIKAGTEKPIKGVDGNTYPGARLESEYIEGGQTVSFHRSAHHDQPIVTLRTKTNDVVRLTKFNGELDAFDLVASTRKLVLDAEPVHGYGGVHFPMVDLNVRPDLDWLIGIRTVGNDGQEATLTQAIQQCKLQMNHVGAIVKDAFAGAVTRGSRIRMPDPDLVIDDDFLFILERPGLSQPVFTAVIRPDAWKNPGELKFA